MDLRVPPDFGRPSARGIEREHRVRAFTLHGLRDLLRDYGVEQGPILDEAGLTADEIADGLAGSRWGSSPRLSSSPPASRAIAISVSNMAPGDGSPAIRSVIS